MKNIITKLDKLCLKFDSKYNCYSVEFFVDSLESSTVIVWIAKDDFGVPQVKSNSSNIQDFITNYELYKDFVRLLDDAFLALNNK